MRNFKEINRTFTVKKNLFLKRVLWLMIPLLTIFTTNVWGKTTIASWGKVSIAASTAIKASDGDANNKGIAQFSSTKAMTTAGGASSNCYYGSSAGGATITFSNLDLSGYSFITMTFYSRASQSGNIKIQYTTNGSTWTDLDNPGPALSGTEGLKSSSFIPNTAIGLKLTHSMSSGSLYFGTVTISGVLGDCKTIDVRGGETVILPNGSTTVSVNDWKNAGAPSIYAAEAKYAIGGGDYCVTLTQTADYNSPNGLQFAASNGILLIESITSNYGVDVEVSISSGSGFSIGLTGATPLTGQSSGVKTISTTSTSADLTISKPTSGAGYVTYIKVIPKTTPPCSNSVTLAHNSPTNGTVSFAPAGPFETCEGTVNTTMTITPAAGYTLTAFNYSTGAGTVSPTNQSPGAPNVTANSATPQAITLTFAQDANGTCTANATFSAIVPTAWSWTYNSAAIPNPINLYIGQTAALVATYTPAGNLLVSAEKNYDVVKPDGLTQVSKTYAVTNPTYTFRADAVMDDGTIVLTNHNHTSLTTTVHVHVAPLPLVHFVDIVHGYEFADVVGTIEDNVLVSNKTTPTHAEYSGTGANDCETDHTRLVGWIEKTWADTHPDASHSDIIGAGTGVFIEANTAINVLTYNGNTYYAVWAKLQ